MCRGHLIQTEPREQTPKEDAPQAQAVPLRASTKQMIKIGRRGALNGYYVGRSTPLGNPYPLRSEYDRNLVCERYERWFKSRVAARDPLVLKELRQLFQLARHGNLTLVCHCSPKRCHAETIKTFLDDYLRADPVYRIWNPNLPANPEPAKVYKTRRKPAPEFKNLKR